MANQKSKNSFNPKDFVLLFLVPIIVVIIALVLVYVPRLLANPTYDFVYSACDNFQCINSFTVDEEGRISQIITETSDRERYYDVVTLRYYDVSDDSSRTLTLEQAQAHKLDTSSRSPDGYNLSSGSSSGGFLFWGSYNDGWYLKSGAKKKKLDLTIGDSVYYYDIKFLGWVIE